MELTRRSTFRPFQFPKIEWSWIPVSLFVGLLVLLLAYPLALLLIKSFVISRPGQANVWSIRGWVEAFADPNLALAIGNTFYLAFVRVVVTTILAIFFAWLVTRTDVPLKGFIELTLWLGFFLPLLPMTMGWIMLLDPYNGLINKGLMTLFGLAKPPFDIYSYSGIIWCHIAFSTSVRFLLLTPAFIAMDAALEDAARASGSNNMGVLMRITVPILAPAVLASTALGFIRSLESLEIEMVLGIPAGIYVVPTKIWDYIHWEPPLYERATALCSIFLGFIVLLIWLHRIFLRGKEFTTVSGRSYLVRTFSLGRWRWFACGISLLFIALMIVLPLMALMAGTFMEFFRQLRHGKGLDGASLDRSFHGPGFSPRVEKYTGARSRCGCCRYAALLVDQLHHRSHADGGPQRRRYSVLVALGATGSSDQLGAALGGIGLGGVCEASLRNCGSAGFGDHHQGNAFRNPDHQSQHAADQQ
jgi:iron(III) transport system permease protein